MSRQSDYLPEDVHGERAREAVFHHPWMSGPRPRWAALSRAGNVTGALALMLILAPLAALIWTILRMRQGPGVVVQERRLGLHSIVFNQWVFRVEPSGGPFCLPEASGLQNIPALLNVLSGEMAIVGPRPVCPHVARREAEHDPFYTSRFAVKPGLLALES